MSVVEPVKPPRTSDPKEIDRFYREVARRLSYLSGSVNPVSDGTAPRWAGDFYYETTSGDWYRSTGVTSASWEQITFAAGTVGDHGSLVGLADDDHTQYIKHSLATAANDFLVASGVGAFIKKTLAEVKTILGLGTAAYTASGDYAVAAKGVTNGDSHDHAGGDGAQIDHGGLAGLSDDDHTQYVKHALVTSANDFLIASGSGAVVKKTLAETKAILGLTVFVERGDPAAHDVELAALTTDGTWRDLDLSSIAPAGAVAVLLRVRVRDDAAGSELMLRENGNSNGINVAIVNTQVANVTAYADVWVALDSNRVVEYWATNTTWTSIYINVCGWVV